MRIQPVATMAPTLNALAPHEGAPTPWSGMAQPAFAYRGRNATGEAVQGVLEGATAAAVADMLFGSGVTPLEIKPAPAGAAEKKVAASVGGSLSLFAEKIGHVDILLFTRQLYTLLKAGVPIMRALAGLQDSSQQPAP